jgi:manganese transport protein
VPKRSFAVIDQEALPKFEDSPHLSHEGDGWHSKGGRPSLPEVFRTIVVPTGGPAWKRLFAFIGPGYLIAVGYMDPGNWATDIAGGAKYRYVLLSAVLLSSILAMFLQALSAKLGIATGRDLAQACRDAYPRKLTIALWLSAEIAIAACDIAEVIGAAIALNLLFHLPMIWGVSLTAADVLLVLALQHKGFRFIEILVISLIATMMAIFGIEVFLSKPDVGLVAKGLIPSVDILRDHDMLYIALGILGATVMPHNLYLHSSIVQTRSFGHTVGEKVEAIRNSYLDSTIALFLAFFVNAAILIVAAAAFYSSGHRDMDDIAKAYKLLTPLLGAAVATPLFAIALLASGQNSTLTGTLAGQVILEGFTHIHIAPWMRRLISRSLAVVPAVIAVAVFGDGSLPQLMIFSQVVLSIQLSFAVIPLIQFTSDHKKMGRFVNGPVTTFIGWAMAAIIAVLNAYLVWTTLFPKK